MRLVSIEILIITATAVSCGPAFALDLVKDGKPVASIVIPSQPLPVETYAAEELQYHVEAATGARLPIFRKTAGFLPARTSSSATARRPSRRKLTCLKSPEMATS